MYRTKAEGSAGGIPLFCRMIFHRPNSRLFFRSFPFCAALLLIGMPLEAQSLWPDSLRGVVEFGGEWIRPTLVVEDTLYPSGRGVWTLSGRLRIKPSLELVVAVPTFVGDDQGYGAYGGAGNPYIGLLLLDDQKRPRASFGYRPGTAARGEWGGVSHIGPTADHDRAEAAYSDAASFNAVLFHDAYRGDDGTNVRLRLGSTLAFAAGYGGVGGNILIDYGIRVGRDTPWYRAGLAFTGRWWMDSEGASWGEASTHQAALDLSFFPGAVRPYVGVRLPLDRPLSGVLDYAVILGLTASFK